LRDVAAPAPERPPAAAPAPEPAPAAVPAPEPRWGLRMDTGETIPLLEAVLVGRDPDAAAVPGARTMRLTDASRSLSKTHALLRPVPGGVEALDWNSTNGTAVIRSGEEHELPPGVAATAAGGDTIRLGDRHAEVVPL
ncbi:FHA domain-containing protein, partial [Microbacterium sp. 179-B 1A2 NHS]|uniref:FHA domain-containing protein n=1 Tax=Microbacterium sp. 179-B 1A2 NHS TaxID=3142383 RepID=UPI0039A2B021